MVIHGHKKQTHKKCIFYLMHCPRKHIEVSGGEFSDQKHIDSFLLSVNQKITFTRLQAQAWVYHKSFLHATF